MNVRRRGHSRSRCPRPPWTGRRGLTAEPEPAPVAWPSQLACSLPPSLSLPPLHLLFAVAGALRVTASGLRGGLARTCVLRSAGPARPAITVRAEVLVHASRARAPDGQDIIMEGEAPEPDPPGAKGNGALYRPGPLQA